MPADLLAGLTTDIPAVRARSAELAAAVARPPWPDGVATEDHHAPSADGTDVLVRALPAGPGTVAGARRSTGCTAAGW